MINRGFVRRYPLGWEVWANHDRRGLSFARSIHGAAGFDIGGRKLRTDAKGSCALQRLVLDPGWAIIACWAWAHIATVGALLLTWAPCGALSEDG